VSAVQVETDKATVTFDATEEGYLAKILVGSGEIKVG
jgi:pyruvate/2-oxoglutarate dehydrogenase complex dihydrolipoamide acyltransferase (E2) component